MNNITSYNGYVNCYIRIMMPAYFFTHQLIITTIKREKLIIKFVDNSVITMYSLELYVIHIGMIRSSIVSPLHVSKFVMKTKQET